MGAWGTGPFDNDTAADLLGEYEDGGVVVLRSVMRDWDDVEAYYDADLVTQTLAVGEIVAACRGVPMAGLSDETRASVLRHAAEVVADDTLLTEARTRVTGDLLDPEQSELAELWGEAGEDDAGFVASVCDLEKRLGGLQA